MVVVYIAAGLLIGALATFVMQRGGMHKLDSQVLLMRQQLAQYEKSDAELRRQLDEKSSEASQLSALLTEMKVESGRLHTMLQDEKDKNASEMTAQKEHFNQQMKTMQEQFVNLAQQVLDRTTDRLRSQNNENIEQLTRPLKTNIEQLQQAINITNETTNKNTASLTQQLRDMAEQTNKIDLTATRLTNVIRGGTSAQGKWGERMLTEILDAQGLKVGVDYDVQTIITDDKGNVVRNDDSGKKMIPDVVLHYPNNEDVVVDAKMSIDAYYKYVNTEDETLKRKYADEMVRNVRTQAANLAKKEYSKYIKAPHRAIDFVIMFVPNEGALQLALQTDPRLWAEAFDKQVFITSQQNLMAILRMIQIAWRQYAQTESQKKVFDLAEELLKRVGDFVERFVRVGNDIKTLESHYAAALEKVQTGRQSVVQKANELKELGVKESATHPIPKIENMSMT